MEPRNLQSGAGANPPEKLANPSVGYPQAGNPATSTPASVGGPFWFYAMAEEMRNVIVGAGLTPNDDELDQFWQAIQTLLTPDPDKIGQAGISTGSTIPSKCLLEAGQELSRASYPDMWAWVQLQSNLVSQATKDAGLLAYSAYYGDGDGATTFTLCDIQGLFTRAADNGRGLANGQALFEYILDQIKAHSHLYGAGISGDSQYANGSIMAGATYSTSIVGGVENTVKNIARLFYVRVIV